MKSEEMPKLNNEIAELKRYVTLLREREYIE